MTFLGFTWYYIVVFLAVLSVLVYVHEFGHYWVARRNGVRVEVFSIGFGPEIWGRHDRFGTRWKVCLIPLGGYVKMFGESMHPEEDAEDARPMTPQEQEVSFVHKRLGQRAAIVAAGPIANFLFAIVAFATVYTVFGNPIPLAVVGEVMPHSAAEAAAFRVGDKILAIDSDPVATFEDVRRIVSARAEVPIRVLIRRGGEETTLVATPRLNPGAIAADAPRIGLLGIKPSQDAVEYKRENPLSALWMGAERTAFMTGQILSYLGQLVAGRQNAGDLGGPLRIAQMSGDVAQEGGLASVIIFMAMLSINLGLINLFPIPMLDGGHLLYYAAEAVRGRPLSLRAQEYGFRVGVALVFFLMVFATWNDLVNLKVFDFLMRLVT